MNEVPDGVTRNIKKKKQNQPEIIEDGEDQLEVE